MNPDILQTCNQAIDFLELHFQVSQRAWALTMLATGKSPMEPFDRVANMTLAAIDHLMAETKDCDCVFASEDVYFWLVKVGTQSGNVFSAGGQYGACAHELAQNLGTYAKSTVRVCGLDLLKAQHLVANVDHDLISAQIKQEAISADELCAKRKPPPPKNDDVDIIRGILAKHGKSISTTKVIAYADMSREKVLGILSDLYYSDEYTGHTRQPKRRDRS